MQRTFIKMPVPFQYCFTCRSGFEQTNPPRTEAFCTIEATVVLPASLTLKACHASADNLVHRMEHQLPQGLCLKSPSKCNGQKFTLGTRAADIKYLSLHIPPSCPQTHSACLHALLRATSITSFSVPNFNQT